jgi:transcriptional regulator with XRE-family HTH domain
MSRKYLGQRPKPLFSVHKLAELREARGMDRKRLADELGIAVQTLGRIENRQIALTQPFIDDVARILRVPRGAIFDGLPKRNRR